MTRAETAGVLDRVRSERGVRVLDVHPGVLHAGELEGPVLVALRQRAGA